MSVFLYIFLFIVTFVLSYEKFKSVANIVSIFTGLWCFFGIISNFGMYGMRVPAFRVHLYAYLFVCVVDFVILLLCKTRNFENVNLITEDKSSKNENYQTYATFVQVVALLFLSPMIINSFKALLESGFVGIRNAYFSPEYESRYLFSLLCKAMPTSFMTGLIVYYTYIGFERLSWKFFGYAILNALVLTFVNGGRYALIQVLLSSIVIAAMKRETASSDKEKFFKSAEKRVLVAIVLVMFVVTVFRKQEFIKNIVVYFSGSFSFLDYILDNSEKFGVSDHLSGYLTFGCITEPIVLGLKVIGLTTMKTPSYLFNIVGQNFYDIGAESEIILFNNNTTVLYYFLRDFGVAGIVIGGVFLAWLLAYSHNKWRAGSEFYALIFVYIASVLLNSIMTYQLFGCGPFFTVVALYFCSKRAKTTR